jgi:oligoribonuclease NrnB/cAMP/cGMP phosphodiesterase (DHH superfamily)
MSDCYHIFTHNDLDGAVSLLAFMWSKPKDTSFQYTPISNMDIGKLKRNISNTHNTPNTFVLDLGLRDEFLPELNQSFVTIIDHHKSSERFLDKFKNANVIYKEYTSNALLVYKLYKDTIDATKEQKLLIALADDFDCNRLELVDSYDLNIIFWTEYQNRFSDFIKDYYNGFKPFTAHQKRAIEYIKREAAKEAEKVPIYYGDLTIRGKTKTVCAAMVEKTTPQVMELLIKKHKPDIFFSINIKSEKVSIRQCTKEDPIDVGIFAEKICNGGGHPNAAAGVITPLFMEITKNLKPI